jgi:hypothetical protein
MANGEHTLKHVCVWDNGRNQWAHIEPEEAAKIYGHRISCSERVFLCECCNKFVALTYSKNGNPFFTHTRNADKKFCEDKSCSAYSYRQYNSLGFSLPVRIVFKEERDFEIKIGFLPLPSNVFDDIEKRDGTVNICTKGSYEKALTAPLLIDRERFSENVCTYYSIRQNIAEQYKLFFSQENEELHKYWPGVIDGISQSGTIFDESGNRLPDDADAEVGHEYILIKKVGCLKFPKEIRKTKEIFLNHGWIAYNIIAENFCQNAANFFIEFGVSLTENPTRFVPLWPPAVQYSHVVLHEANEVFLCLHGDGCIEHYPRKAACQSDKIDDAHSLIEISAEIIQQLVSVSRSSWKTSALGYIMLKKQAIAPLPILEKVLTVDIAGNELNEPSYHAVPNGGVIVIHAPFDGYINVIMSEIIIEHYEINGGRPFTLDRIGLGCSIAIYQGLDCERKISFIREKRQTEISVEANMLKRLRQAKGNVIPVGHSIARFTVKLKQYPKLKQWLLKSIRDGFVHEDAIAILNSMLRRDDI